tara:strand:+ start:2041 stop:2394 length:354 start_codon:yes stop_codon:yes gene_type:complete
MNKKIAILALAGLTAVLTLAGCADDRAPTDENFRAILLEQGVLEHQTLDGPLEVLMDYGRYVCKKLDEGMTGEEVVVMAYVETKGYLPYYNAFLSSSVAATKLYCPEYEDLLDGLVR